MLFFSMCGQEQARITISSETQGSASQLFSAGCFCSQNTFILSSVVPLVSAMDDFHSTYKGCGNCKEYNSSSNQCLLEMAKNLAAKHRITQNSKYFAFIKKVEWGHFSIWKTKDLDISIDSEVLETSKSLLIENRSIFLAYMNTVQAEITKSELIFSYQEYSVMQKKTPNQPTLWAFTWSETCCQHFNKI